MRELAWNYTSSIYKLILGRWWAYGKSPSYTYSRRQTCGQVTRGANSKLGQRHSCWPIVEPASSKGLFCNRRRDRLIVRLGHDFLRVSLDGLMNRWPRQRRVIYLCKTHRRQDGSRAQSNVVQRYSIMGPQQVTEMKITGLEKAYGDTPGTINFRIYIVAKRPGESVFRGWNTAIVLSLWICLVK